MEQQPAGGWIKAHRRLFDPRFAWPILWRYYFLDLISMAEYEPRDGLARGQLRTSGSQLAVRWGISESSVARFLDRLEADGAAGRERQTSGRVSGVITISNYASYQAPAQGRRQTSGRHAADMRQESGPVILGRKRNKNKNPTPPSAAPEEPTQRRHWPTELQKIWDVLLAVELLGTELDSPTWWATQVLWIESTGLPVYPLDELKAYIAHQESIRAGGKGKHRDRRRGFRNWLATATRWKERDAAREAIRNRERPS